MCAEYFKQSGPLFRQAGDIKASLKHIENSLDDYDRFDAITRMSIDDVDNILYRSEKIALSCRNAMQHMNTSSLNNPDTKKDQIASSALPVSVEFDQHVLLIKTPLTFKRFYRDKSIKENYMLMQYVRAALNKWIDKNGQELYHSITPPFVAVIKRKSVKFNHYTICDNDNLENGRIINEIFDVLGYSDNAMITDLYSCFRECKSSEDSGMEFAVFQRSESAVYLPEIVGQ